MKRAPDSSETPPDGGEGRPIVLTDLAGTAVFVAAGIAATVGGRAGTGVMIAVSVALFAIGIATFLWSFFAAAERSRSDEIGVAALYVLTGPTAPAPVRRRLLGALGVQIVAAIVFATIGFTGLADDEVNGMAFGILVPMFGIGLDGLWASRHGRFGPRMVTAREQRSAAGHRHPPGPRRHAPDPSHDLENHAHG